MFERSKPRLFLLLLALPCFLAADSIVTKDGTVTEGRIISENQEEVVVEITPGMRSEIPRANIKEIHRDPAQAKTPSEKKASPSPQNNQPANSGASASTGPAAPVSNSLPTDSLKKKQLKEDWEAMLGYMEKEPLEVWPEPEPDEKIQENESKTAKFKAEKADGSFEYLENAPDPNAGHTKVWFKSRPTQYMISYIGPGGGTIGTASKTSAQKWVRQYFHSKTHDWGSPHPNELACNHDQDYALGLLNKIEEAISPGAGGKTNSLWYEMLNAHAGSTKDESIVQANIQKSADELQQVSLQLGEAAGVHDLLWRIHKMTIDCDPKISKTATIEQRVALSKERRALFKQAVAELSK